MAAEEDLLPVALENFVAVTDDHAHQFRDGCDEVTIVDSSIPSTVGRSDFRISPGQMAVTSDGRQLVVVSQHGSVVTLLQWDHAGSQWVTTWLADDPRYINGAAPAISPDDRILLLPRENGIGKYLMSSLGGERLGEPVARVDFLNGGMLQNTTVPADVAFSADGRLAYVAATDGMFYVLDVDEMKWRGEPLAYQYPARKKAFRTRRTFLALSPNERFVVINTGDMASGEVNVIDLSKRSQQLVEVPGFSESWGVKFNYAGVHRGKLAVHGRDSVGVFTMSDQGTQFRKWATALVPAASFGRWPAGGKMLARLGALGWTGDGSSVVAAIGFPSWKEWRVLRLAAGETPRLVNAMDFDSCTAEPVFNILQRFDVITLNDRLERPTLTLTPTSTATATDVPPTSTATGAPTVTQTPSATPSATRTSIPTKTAVPAPIYVPIALRERCVPGEQRQDAVLVIDTSSSMEQLTRDGRQKLAAARDAAARYVALLDFDAGDRAAIVSFDQTARTEQALTDQRQSLTEALDRLAIGRETCVPCALETAVEQLAAAERYPGNMPVVVLLTDGRSNPRPIEEAVSAAEDAKAQGVVIFTIGLGPSTEAEALREIASAPEFFYRAPDGEDLAGIYERIAVEVPCPTDRFWGRR